MRAFLFCAAAFIAGCQAPPSDLPVSTSTAASTASVAPAAPAAPPAAAAPTAPAPTTTAATPEPGVPEPVPSLPTAEQDTCGASAYSVWVGQEHTKLPAAPAGKAVRVVCSTCAMTMDFSAERLNVIYDEKTGLITRLSCG